MAPLDSDAEFQNIEELTKFRLHWRRRKDYPRDNVSNDHIYVPAMIDYQWSSGRWQKRFQSIFRAFVGAGRDDGRIDIDETSGVDIDHFHLRFSPAFQTYEYDGQRRSLIIKGSSSKMGGDYIVQIFPLISEPS